MWAIHPVYSQTDILDMECALMKYRGKQPSNILSVEFIYYYNDLQKDIRDKKLDPFPYKIMLHPASTKG